MCRVYLEKKFLVLPCEINLFIYVTRILTFKNPECFCVPFASRNKQLLLHCRVTGPRGAQGVDFFGVETEVEGRGRPMFQRATETVRRVILLTEGRHLGLS